ncbi:hypothetical protein KY361_07950, partial [Candidatus Woesearchaeota archaeon]|nr:hypothetical protein [Candidatus Woesearchaeota archaeon]
MADFWEIGIGRRLRYQVYNIIFLAVAGLAFIFLLPFFGLPSFALLGMAFFLWSFYIVFPNEREVKADILKEIYDSMNYNPSTAAPPPDITPFANDLRELVAKAPSLIIRSILKISIFVLAILQFFTFNRLIALILSFIFYFMLPGRFKESQINKALEGLIRIPLSIFMAWLFLVTFGGNEVGVALAFLGLAFFFNFPVTIEEGDKKELRFKISSISFKGSESRTFDRLVFGLLMLASLFFSGIWNMGTTTLWVFGVIWLISLVSGWSTGPEGKPAIGIMMIIIALFAFATTYTGVMGQAIFGYWWPQVYSATEYIGGIFEPIWMQTQKTFSDSWLLLTNPAAYYEKIMAETQATKTVVKKGGTTRSIELIKFDIFTSFEGYIDPFIDPVVGSVELENQGEFIADRINLTVQPVWVDPEKLTEIAIGKFSRFECSKPTAQYPDKGTCSWPGPGSEQVTYPKEIKMGSFVINSSYFDEGTWKSNSINLADCEKCENDKCTNKIDCACDDPNALYKHANQIIKFNSIYNYDYNVNVSIDAEIINADLYFELLKAREITLEDFTSQYSGGPVKATIWSQKQP